MKPFMSKRRKDAIKEEHARNAAARRRNSSGTYNPLIDPANQASVYHQTNHFYPDGSYTSEDTRSDSGFASRSDESYGSRDYGSSSSSYDSGSSSSSYDSGSSGGGSYGE